MLSWLGLCCCCVSSSRAVGSGVRLQGIPRNVNTLSDAPPLSMQQMPAGAAGLGIGRGGLVLAALTPYQVVETHTTREQTSRRVRMREQQEPNRGALRGFAIRTSRRPRLIQVLSSCLFAVCQGWSVTARVFSKVRRIARPDDSERSRLVSIPVPRSVLILSQLLPVRVVDCCVLRVLLVSIPTSAAMVASHP